MNFFDSFASMLVLLAAIVVGYLSNKLHYMGGDFDRKLTRLLLDVFIPFNLVAAVLTSSNKPTLRGILDILLVSVIYYGMAFLFAWLLPKLLRVSGKQAGVYRFAMAFTNVGFIGYPVVTALFGREAMFYAAMLTLPFSLLAYSLGPIMLSGQSVRVTWRNFATPNVIAALVALVLALTHAVFPAKITEAIDFIGAMAIPLALVILGSILAGIPIRQIVGTPRLWVMVAMRLLVIPAILLVILKTIGISGLLFQVAVTQAAMPIATNGSLLALQYGGDSKLMAQATLLTTVASIFTIPLMAMFLG